MKFTLLRNLDPEEGLGFPEKRKQVGSKWQKIFEDAKKKGETGDGDTEEQKEFGESGIEGTAPNFIVT